MTDSDVATADASSAEGSAGLDANDLLWYKDAVIYQLHVKAFFDSDSDGMGDFRGLTSKLDYIRELGVTAIWLLPFFPSPMKDDGYDVAYYRDVNSVYGTRADFRLFVREAHRLGLKVIIELVINHTSDQHPWFEAARRAARGSSKRNFYVWTDDPLRYRGTRIILKDAETSNWAWDEVAQQYYWHRFCSHEPDLNFDNPSVLKAVMRALRFWLDIGVDGVCLDAVPYLHEREGTSNANLPETHQAVKTIRQMIDARYGNRILVAEANQWPESVREYFGEGDECHMAYHFPLMPRMYMAIAQEDRHPVVEIMQQTPDIPHPCQWAIFLRNHDELTLEMVTSKERDYMYRMYAADPRARLHLGIRRRLAPLMENDIGRIKLMDGLLLSMPGSPIIYYGDEIGMGDNLFFGERSCVRTPMQWIPDRNAGFSRADPQRLFLPPIMDPVYGYEAVNVEAQLRDAGSLLNWMKRMLAVRSSSKAFGRGRLEFLHPGNRKVLAYIREHAGEAILCVANLARSAQPVQLDLSRFRGRVPLELLGRTPFPPVGEMPYMLTLAAHGFYWFQLAADVPIPSWHDERIIPEDLPVLVLFDGWLSFFRERAVPWRIAMAQKTRALLEEQVLPRYLRARGRAAQQGPLQVARLVDHVLWEDSGNEWMIAAFSSEDSARPTWYFLPLALIWGDMDEDRLRGLGPVMLARVRQRANVGILADAFGDEHFCRALIAAIGRGGEIRTENGLLKFVPTRSYATIASSSTPPEVAPPRMRGGHTIVALGPVVLKAYRHADRGIHPEVEIGRFLTEVVHFPNCVPLAGVLEHIGKDGSVTTPVILQGHVRTQGDAWAYTLDYLARFLEVQGAATYASTGVHGAYLTLVQTLGVRTAELHAAFAQRTGDPAFDPEPVGVEDYVEWRRRLREDALATWDLLARKVDRLPSLVSNDARDLLERRDQVLVRIESPIPLGARLKTRYHGDYHLGCILIAQNDVIIADFEGEANRPQEERRLKHTPLRDVAAMLRSFSYAAGAALARSLTSTDEQLKIAPRVVEWETQACDAFLTAYNRTTHDAGLYDDAADRRALLSMFLLERALYELRYELKHRPDWVRYPLASVARLAV